MASDEIKSASYLPASAGFHRIAISSTMGGFLPAKADLVEKSTSYEVLFTLANQDGKTIINLKQINEIVPCTMKSEQARMKSSAYGFR